MDKRNFVGVGFSLMKCRSVFLKLHKITFPLYYIHAMALLVKDLTTQENCNELFTGKKKCYLSPRLYFYIFRSTILKRKLQQKNSASS